MNKPSYLKWIIGAGVIVVAVAVGSQLKFGDNLVYFFVPSEVTEKIDQLQDQVIKVGAMVKKDSVSWHAKELDLKFVITDYEGNEFHVTHKGTKPDMFQEDRGVVVEGRLKDHTIEAKTLMVKHSEEYKSPDKEHSVDKELLKKSIFK